MIPHPDKKRIGFCRNMARKKLNKYFLEFPPFKLPIPIVDIARYFRFEIFELNNLGKHQRAIKYVQEGRKLIGINSTFSLVNRRFSIGHELGHDFLGHPSEDECSKDEVKFYDREADEFSAEMLIPFEDLKIRIQKNSSISDLISLYNVSEQALFLKIQNQNLLKFL